MYFSSIIAATVAAAPIVAAHGGVQGMPKIFGMGAGALKARDIGFAARRSAVPPHPHKFNKRQGGVDGQCGPAAGGATCAQGYCCSPAGWCGNTEDYCAAPDCLIDYGSGCDANSIPNGETTLANMPRPKLGSVEYGGDGIYACQEPGTIAITYDDGPYIYTNDVLDTFAKYGFKATFFVTGNNNAKGAIDDASTPWPAVITRMINEGHQVASHTWSHQDLSAITHEQRIDQMVRNEMAIRNIIQKFPTYMRPPYSSCTAESGCEKDLADLGYVVVYFDVDTTDYLNTTPDKIQNAKDVFASYVKNSNPATDTFLSIEHDIHQQTALNLTGYMLEMMQAKGYRGVTVGECLGDPEANWYRASSGKIVTSSSARPMATQSSGTGSSAAPTATPTGTSEDGTCGISNSLTCKGWNEASTVGECCSPAGWCGSSTAHCGDGCQSAFGVCGNGNSTTDVPSSSVPSATISSSSVQVSSSSSVTSSVSSTTSSVSSALVSSASSAAPTATPSKLTPSTDGTCGGESGFTCIGTDFGSCCSQNGWCGSTADYCSTGCNAAFGTCEGSSPSSAPAASSSVQTASVASSSIVSSTSSVMSSLSSSASVSASSSTPATTVSADPSASSAVSSLVASISSILSSSISASASASSISDSLPPLSILSSTSSASSSSAIPTSSTSASSSAAFSSSTIPPSSAASSQASAADDASSTCCTSTIRSTTTISSATLSTSVVVPTSSAVPAEQPTAPVAPAPSAKVSTNGRCGARNGGTTCAGYRGIFNLSLECCGFAGICGGDLLACRMGCQKGYGKCW